MGSAESENVVSLTIRGDAVPVEQFKSIFPQFFNHLEAVMFDCDGEFLIFV